MAKSSRNSPGKIVASKRSPILENGKVPSRQRTTRSSAPRSRSTLGSPLPPRRQLNADRRSREYLTPDEVEKVLQAAGRHGPRDRTLLLLGHRHGSESRRSSHCIGTSGISKQASFTFRDS